jgi:hypothetical protein
MCAEGLWASYATSRQHSQRLAPAAGHLGRRRLLGKVVVEPLRELALTPVRASRPQRICLLL